MVERLVLHMLVGIHVHCLSVFIYFAWYVLVCMICTGLYCYALVNMLCMLCIHMYWSVFVCKYVGGTALIAHICRYFVCIGLYCLYSSVLHIWYVLVCMLYAGIYGMY